MSANPRLATYRDLMALPETVRGELLHGEIHASPSPTPVHQGVSGRLGGIYGARFDWSRGGPGGWWIVPDVDVQFGEHDVVRPDLSGWRRERMPAYPTERPIQLVPDWVSEILSPSSVRQDRLIKANLYLAHQVPFFWLVDPDSRLVEALECQGTCWVRLGVWGEGDQARIPPFEAVEIEISDLFPPVSAAGGGSVAAPGSGSP